MTLALIVTALYFITAGLLVGLSRPLLAEAGIGSRDTVATLAVLILLTILVIRFLPWMIPRLPKIHTS